MNENKIADLIQNTLESEQFPECFLVEYKLHANNKLEVFVDSDQGLSLGKCQKISRAIEAHLDSEKWLGEKYVLEVSSPGTDRPLKLARQYPKHIGRKLEVRLQDGTSYTGKLTEVEGHGIVLTDKRRIKEGNRKKTVEVNTEIPFDAIAKAIVKISFTK